MAICSIPGDITWKPFCLLQGGMGHPEGMQKEAHSYHQSLKELRDPEGVFPL